MKIDYISDLHINHWVRFTHAQEKWEKQTKEWMRSLLPDEPGEVLIAAGDFSEWNRQSLWFLEEASNYYQRIYIVAGNHDYYLLSKNQRNKYGTSLGRRYELFGEAELLGNVTPLHGNVDTYKGIRFGGHSLWYDLSKPEDFEWHMANSNDSVYIDLGIPKTKNWDYLWEEATRHYGEMKDDPIDVFVSHVPPLHPPIASQAYNASYLAPVPFLKGRHWVCGHQHLQGDFERTGVQFHMNAAGYPQERHEVKIRNFKL